jgi:succinyl-diaminopimelate desuccinylase
LVHEPYEERPQAVATVGAGDPTLVSNSHIDVVPAGDLEQWTHDPYAGEIQDGQLYGGVAST